MRYNKTWLAQHQYYDSRIEWCMKRAVCALERFRTQIKYKYAEGNLVDVWEVWWAQNRYELSYTEVDR